MSGDGVNRRDFFKLAGAAAASASIASSAGIGYLAGSNPYSHTGWENTERNSYFDRKRFEIDTPKYKQLSTPKRVSYLTHRFSRRDNFIKPGFFDNKREWTDELVEWYERFPKALELDREYVYKVLPELKETLRQVGERYALHNAFFNAYRALQKGITVSDKPEVYDWEGVDTKKTYGIRDVAGFTEVIKQVGRVYGATVVQVAKLNPIWAYDKSTGGRGYKRGEPIDVPEWWEFAIVLGVPHEWNQMRANPTFGHSQDAYNEASIAAARMTTFIKSLGYPARPHSPHAGYEIIVPPVLVDAGVGEQGRFGFVVTPETGGNFRPAVVTTNIPLIPDKPVDLGIKEFCQSCKICAETCPSQSISYDDVGNIRGRGYEGWEIDIESCHNYWTSVPGSGSCRICLAVCPFSKRANWLHTTARDVAVRDKTHLSAPILTTLERVVYGQHEPEHFLGPDWGTYREKPWWFDAERFLDI